MAKMYEVERKEIPIQAQKIIKSVHRNSSADDKATAGLALSLLALVSTETNPNIAQQFLKFIKDLKAQ